MIQEFLIDGNPRLSIFDTSTPYYQFVVKMKQVTPETDVDAWMHDHKSQFAFNQGYEVGRLLDKDRTVYMENAELKEELKAKQVVLNDFKSRVETVTDRFNRKSSQLTYAKTIIKDLLDNSDEYARQRAEDFLKENK